MPHFMEYLWPGSVREMEKVVERFVVLADGDLVQFSISRTCCEGSRTRST